MWKFTCFNGTEYISNVTYLLEAIKNFEKETGHNLLDIKHIDNLT